MNVLTPTLLPFRSNPPTEQPDVSADNWPWMLHSIFSPSVCFVNDVSFLKIFMQVNGGLDASTLSILEQQNKVSGSFKVPVTSMRILNICNLWILLRKIVIYLVGRKCHLHGLFWLLKLSKWRQSDNNPGTYLYKKPLYRFLGWLHFRQL